MRRGIISVPSLRKTKCARKRATFLDLRIKKTKKNSTP